MIAKVMHSQRLIDTPLKLWVICETEGKIIACHCNCMASLGESCSHVGAILFAVDAVKRMRENKTVTQEKAYWLLPSRGKKSLYGPVSDMNFTSPSTQKKPRQAAM